MLCILPKSVIPQSEFTSVGVLAEFARDPGRVCNGFRLPDPDAGCWVLGAGCWGLVGCGTDFGCWRCWVLGAGCWGLVGCGADFGCWRCWVLGAGCPGERIGRKKSQRPPKLNRLNKPKRPNRPNRPNRANKANRPDRAKRQNRPNRPK